MSVTGGAQRLSKRALARLIKKSMRGDAKAFAELYQTFINTIYYNVNSTLIDKNEVEDAVQQVVVSLHKSLHKLKSPYAFHSYLYRITMNVCYKYNQKEISKRYNTQAELDEELIDDKGKTPPQELESKERDELVRLFISKLPEKQRYTLLLYYYYDLSYKSIAEVMDTTVTSVGSNINRAKKNMKRMLEEHENENAGVEAKGDDFRGASLDSLFAAAFSSTIEEALDPGKADILWQKCIEQCPEIAANTPGVKTNKATRKAILAGVIASGAVVGVGALAIQQAIDPPVEPEEPAPITQPSLFIPQSVSIAMESSNPDYPETYNPARAEIELSEGFPLEWLIVNEAGAIVFQGEGSVIDHTVFDALERGAYQIEWTISNEAGDTGVAYRDFSMVDESNFP